MILRWIILNIYFFLMKIKRAEKRKLVDCRTTDSSSDESSLTSTEGDITLDQESQGRPFVSSGSKSRDCSDYLQFFTECDITLDQESQGRSSVSSESKSRDCSDYLQFFRRIWNN